MNLTTENYAIYYMRVIAIVFIVNSHFNSKNIIGFESFGVYGSLGYLGNMIFFFISAYVLSIGFSKYENQLIRWTIYRVSYLLSILLIIGFLTGMLEGNIVDRFSHIGLFEIGFVSLMIFFSSIYTILWSLSKRLRLIFVLSFYLTNIIITYELDLGITNVSQWTTLVHVLDYLIIFMLGIIIAKDELRFSFNSLLLNMIFVCIAGAIFIFSKCLSFDYTLYATSRYAFICYLFFSFNQLKFSLLPEAINKMVKIIALLSLYIYLTHNTFGLINFSYHLNKQMALFILFVICIPICILERAALNPLINKIKKLIVKPAY